MEIHPDRTELVSSPKRPKIKLPGEKSTAAGCLIKTANQEWTFIQFVKPLTDNKSLTRSPLEQAIERESPDIVMYCLFTVLPQLYGQNGGAFGWQK